jgi:SAM-dependent methyltransferase
VPSLLALVAVVLLGAHSIDGAHYSPYNRIDVYDKGTYFELDVNREYHQFIYDFSDTFLKSSAIPPNLLWERIKLRNAYDLPFLVNSARNSALIVGAGTGNDVQAALRNGYRSVHAVDIDGRLVDLGRKLHPERPYASPAVVPVVNDARAFFEQYRGAPFDVVSFGLLDSHAMFSSMSSLRLDNYVYTVEGIRAAWKHVAPQGHLSISFSVYAGPWIADRLYWTIAEATGKKPVAVHTEMNYGGTFLVAPDMERLDSTLIGKFRRLVPQQPAAATKVTTDDWPFLYIRPGLFPWGYVMTLGAVLAMTLLVLPLAFGGWGEVRGKFDPALFFLGAAFMLLETRGITSLSLVFGSTWVVNAAIFFGVLLVALVANLAVERLHATASRNVRLWFWLLFVSLAGLWLFDNAWLSQFPLLVRGLAGGVVNVLPVAFAGIVFSVLFSRTQSPEAALGSNLLGAVLGGCAEYLSMLLGLRSLVLLAAAFYVLALLCVWRRREAAG